MKKKNEKDIQEDISLNEDTIKVIFNHTYIGVLGNFYAGMLYTISTALYDVLKRDCEKK